MLKFTNLTRLFLFLKSSPKCTQYSCFGPRKCQTSPDSLNGQVPVGECTKWSMKDGECSPIIDFIVLWIYQILTKIY